MNSRFLGIAILVVPCLAVAGAAQKKAAPPRAASAPATAAAPKPYKGPIPPLPKADFPLPRPVSVVSAVFEFAARRPDVLHYVPCFCGCEQAGHVGNDDCFVKSRDSSGKPTAWELHGMG